MTLEPALSFERLRHDINSEMGLAARPVAGMPDVLMGFVHHVETFRGESCRQLLRDEIAGCHGVGLPGAFSGKVDTGFPQKMRPLKEPWSGVWRSMREFGSEPDGKLRKPTLSSLAGVITERAY